MTDELEESTRLNVELIDALCGLISATKPLTKRETETPRAHQRRLDRARKQATRAVLKALRITRGRKRRGLPAIPADVEL